MNYKQIRKMSVELYRDFADNYIMNHAAALAYSTLLSLVPFLVVIFYISSHLPIFQNGAEVVQRFIVNHFVATSANVIETHLQDFLQQMGKLSWIGVASLAFVALWLMYNMVSVFNIIWRAQIKRSLALSFIIYLIILLVTPIIFGSLILLSSYLSSLSFFLSQKGVAVRQPLLFILPYFSTFIAFTLLNWALPSCRVRLKAAVMAGAITMILFESAKYFFVLYLSYFPTYQLLYGALATIPIFLVWLFLSWSIILFGAVVCYHVHSKA